MPLKITIDTRAIAESFKELAAEVQADLNKGVAQLAAATHSKVAEMANSELHSSKKTFTDNLGFQQVAPGLWVVSIDEKALWIEEGIEANKDMKPDLLKNATGQDKEGYRTKTIPFEHSKAPSQMNGYAQGLQAKIKSELRKRDLPYKKIERNENGSPRLGKLHTFDFKGGRAKSSWTDDPLTRVTIYQTLTKSGNVRRDIMTFRTVSDNPNQKDKWIHPGMDGKKFLDRAQTWAETTWENEILPAIMDKWK